MAGVLNSSTSHCNTLLQILLVSPMLWSQQGSYYAPVLLHISDDQVGERQSPLVTFLEAPYHLISQSLSVFMLPGWLELEAETALCVKIWDSPNCVDSILRRKRLDNLSGDEPS